MDTRKMLHLAIVFYFSPLLSPALSQVSTNLGNEPFPSVSLDSPFGPSDFVNAPDASPNFGASLDFSPQRPHGRMRTGKSSALSRASTGLGTGSFSPASSESSFGLTDFGNMPEGTLNLGRTLNRRPKRIQGSLLTGSSALSRASTGIRTGPFPSASLGSSFAPSNFVNAHDAALNRGTSLHFSPHRLQGRLRTGKSNALSRTSTGIRTGLYSPVSLESPFGPSTFGNTPEVALNLGTTLNSRPQRLQRRLRTGSSALSRASTGIRTGPFLSASLESPFRPSNFVNMPHATKNLGIPFNFQPAFTPGELRTDSSDGITNKTVPEVVDLFASSFSKAIQSSKTLTEIYTVQKISPIEAGRDVFERVYQYLSYVSAPNTMFLAGLASQATELNIAHTTPSSLSYICAYTTGMELFKLGILTKENASDLANSFVDEVQKTLVFYKPNIPETKIHSITKSISTFLVKYGALTAATSRSLVKYFVLGLYFLSKD